MSNALPQHLDDAHLTTELRDGVQDEIAFARALTAVILAVKLDLAEDKAQSAFERVAGAPVTD